MFQQKEQCEDLKVGSKTALSRNSWASVTAVYRDGWNSIDLRVGSQPDCSDLHPGPTAHLLPLDSYLAVPQFPHLKTSIAVIPTP